MAIEPKNNTYSSAEGKGEVNMDKLIFQKVEQLVSVEVCLLNNINTAMKTRQVQYG
jgi:hypothetical protein